MRRLLSLVLALALLLGCAAAETAEPRNEDAQITSKNLPLYYQKADRIKCTLCQGQFEFSGLRSAGHSEII